VSLFTTVSVDVPGWFSDNCVTLLPSEPLKLAFTPRKGENPSLDRLKSGVKISNLAQTF
jgi:beta-mannosidase